jgi:hypothetical protein
MARKQTETEPEATTPEADAEDPRTYEHPEAQSVREGQLSAAQLPGGHGNVDPSNPDAQYPPGVVQRTPVLEGEDVDPSSFVPERRTATGFVNTAGTPDYGTHSEE